MRRMADPLLAVRARSNSIEQELQSASDGVDDGSWKLSDSFGEFGLIHRHDLRYIHHARLRQVCIPSPQCDITGRMREPQV